MAIPTPPRMAPIRKIESSSPKRFRVDREWEFSYKRRRMKGPSYSRTPFKKTFNLFLIAQVAQLVEQWTENPRVGGSIPPLGTIFLSSPAFFGLS